MRNNDDKVSGLKGQILIETYKIVSTEILLYLKEIIRCFAYASILIALYLGLGIEESSKIVKEIRNYIPYGFFILTIYFLSLSYIRLSLTIYRVSLEKQIKDIVPDFIGLETNHLTKFQRFGFLKLSDKKLSMIPTPMIFLGIITVLVIFMIFKGHIIGQLSILNLILFFLCFFITIYVFFVYPFLAKKVLKKIK